MLLTQATATSREHSSSRMSAALLLTTSKASTVRREGERKGRYHFHSGPSAVSGANIGKVGLLVGKIYFDVALLTLFPSKISN